MIKIFNSYTGKKEIFHSIVPKQVSMYVCGMTVYDDCHVGHARVMIVFDLIYRWLMESGYSVTYIRNITDIDDKILNKANISHCHFSEITAKYIQSMVDDAVELNILEPSHQPKATESIDEMIEMIKDLKSKGIAYVGDNGDIFFDISKFPDYGYLSKKNLDDLNAGSRVELDQNKKNPFDFVLWKKTKNNEPCWPSPWGDGRPGWHIECSAMSTKYLGKSFDIHGGGQDLIFPHHENEIAQSESCHDQKMANYWIHNGFVKVDDEKMSKSLGNFFTLKTVLKDYNGEILRFFILRSHYRSPLNYSNKNLEDAESAIKKIYIALRNYPCKEVELDWDKPYLAEFRNAMDDDFNSPKAIAIIFELLNTLNKKIDNLLANEIFTLLKKIGLMSIASDKFLMDSLEIDATLVEQLIDDRNQAKINKDYQTADQIRKQIESYGALLEDTPQGTVWRKK
ncbi:MAG: cysteine--tRNA ligase [Proteobacteria bacterium]|nr:cysteine--tRNA ligase [Pseudomonadota bacterium]